jgi:hypothetical protein
VTLIYEAQERERERERERESLIQLNSTTPVVEGVNYFLFSMLLEMVLMESKRQPGAALAASPLDVYALLFL